MNNGVAGLEAGIDALADMMYPALVKAAGRKGVGWKHDASGTPISTGYGHGPGGQFTFPGVDPAVFHTIVGNIGLFGQLPAVSTRAVDPTFYVLTGVQDEVGSEKSGACDDPPVAGLTKGGLVHAPLGFIDRMTPEILLPRLGQVNDRADPMDLSLIGSPIDAGGVFAQGPRDPSVPGDLLTNEVSKKMFELNIATHRKLALMLWQGTPANNTAGGGYKEFPGFDQLIITGHVDAETNNTLPSMDADIQSFGNTRIDSAGTLLVDKLFYMYMTRKSLAVRTGVMPVRWVIAMREELFYEVTKVWPCSYLTYQCQPAASNQVVQINAADQVKMRDDMRANRYLMLNGDRVDVVLDDGIDFDDGNSSGGSFPKGCFRSSIYLIPMSVVGGRAVTFLEYFDFSNPSLVAALQNGLGDGGVAIQGPWMISVERKKWCVRWTVLTMPRLIMRTPWLAGKLQNVVYCPTENARQPFPDDPYYVNGGRTGRPGPSFYDPW